MLMQLRKNCNHPDLLVSHYDESISFPPVEELISQCGKMQLLDKLLKRLHAAGHKVGACFFWKLLVIVLGYSSALHSLVGGSGCVGC
jgi:ATP-dependent DNA helicase